MLQEPSGPASDDGPKDMEAQKTAIVRDMLGKIRPFVAIANGQSLIKLPCDWPAFAQLLRQEERGGLVPRLLLLTMLLHPGHGPAGVWRDLAGQAEVLAIIESWFKEEIGEMAREETGQPQHPLLLKLLDLLAVIPFTLDQLLEHRLGRLLKKLTSLFESGAGPGSPGVQEKAEVLFKAWTALTEQQSLSISAKAKSGSETQPLPDPPAPRDAKEEPAIEAVPLGAAAAGFATSRQHTHAPSGVAASERPMSADDIQKEKKRRAYLESIGYHAKPSEEQALPASAACALPEGPVEGRVPGLQLPQAELTMEEPRRKRPKALRRVSFPDDPARLVQVRLFEPDSDSDSSFSPDRRFGHDYHQKDRNEASYAFDKLRAAMEAEMEWHRPEPIPTLEVLPLSEQCRVQRERERVTISVSYGHSSQPVVPKDSPKSLEDAPQAEPTVIPIRDSSNTAPQTRTVPALVTADSMAAQSGPPAIGQMSPELLSSLLMNIHQQPINKPQQSNAIQQSTFATGTEARAPLPQQSGQKVRARPPCKFYRAGVASSCRSGPACPFRHGDT